MSFGQWKPTITLKYQPFPKQACIHKIINEPIDSNPQDDIYNLGEHPCQKASLCSFFKGSYTLEAAVIIPVAAVIFPYALIFLSGIADSDRSSGGVELCKQKNSM